MCLKWITKRWSGQSMVRFLKTILIFISYAIVGYSDSILGVNMGQFEIALDAKTNQTSMLASVSFAGFTLGNVILSVLPTSSNPRCGMKANLQVVYISCLFVSCVCNFVIPHVASHFIPLSFLILLSGISGGIIQAASIARVLILWGKESSVYLQVLDLVYSIGAIIGPFVCQPFLVDVPQTLHTNNTLSEGVERTPTPADLMLVFPYGIIAIIGSLTFLISILVYIKWSKDQDHPSRNQEQEESSDPSTKTQEVTIPFWKTFLMVSLASLTYAFTNGMLNIESIFLTKYVSSSGFNLPSATGASLLGTSWTVHVVSVVVFVFLIRFLGVGVSLSIGVTLILLSNMVLLLTTACGFYSPTVLWLCVVLMSIGGSTFFGPLVAFMEMYFPVSPAASSFYLIPNCIGNILWPLFVGHLFDNNPDIVVHSMASCAVISTILVLMIIIVADKMFKKK